VLELSGAAAKPAKDMSEIADRSGKSVQIDFAWNSSGKYDLIRDRLGAFAKMFKNNPQRALDKVFSLLSDDGCSIATRLMKR